MKNKRAQLLNSTILQIILIGIVISVFVIALNAKASARGVKQQIVEKELALLIDSGIPGMSFEINKVNFNGYVGGVSLKDGKIFVRLNDLKSLRGYPYFSRYEVSVEELTDKFVVRINEK